MAFSSVWPRRHSSDVGQLDQGPSPSAQRSWAVLPGPGTSFPLKVLPPSSAHV